ncbi:MAG: CDP-glycerol glycerophosphotransferase family protein, partial [Chlamydiales bacterium]
LHVAVGNYRYHYYQQHKEFFDSIISCHLPPMDRKTVLYAPTWSFPQAPGEEESTFFALYPDILEHVPDGYNLLVKLHPYFFRLFPEKVATIRAQFESERIHFIDDIPLVYPLLDKVDIYLGDYSSVGYDFLTYNRPLFFLPNSVEDPFLFRCGTKIEDPKRVFQAFEEKDRYASERQRLYHDCFADVTLKEDTYCV